MLGREKYHDKQFRGNIVCHAMLGREKYHDKQWCIPYTIQE